MSGDDGTGEQAPVRTRRKEFEPRSSDTGSGMPEDRLLTDDEMVERFIEHGRMSRPAAEAVTRYIRHTPH